jgi:hypothetical protein
MAFQPHSSPKLSGDQKFSNTGLIRAYVQRIIMQTILTELLRPLRLGVFAADIPVFGCGGAALGLCGKYSFTGAQRRLIDK